MKLIPYTLATLVAAGMGLYIIDGTRAAVKLINSSTAQRCQAYNQALPGACRLPSQDR
jgi:hypothetical protein